MSNPPPLPPKPPMVPEYGRPGAPQPPGPPAGAEGTAQRVFDTVAGPNLRLRDNLIQLACVVVGTAAGAGIGMMLTEAGESATPFIMIGALGGMVASLLLSGLVIGIVRLVTGTKRR